MAEEQAKLIYRFSVPAAVNAAELIKGYPLTYEEIDKNNFSINYVLGLKAPILNTNLVGVTSIQDLRATNTGQIDNIPVGIASPRDGKFVVLSTTSNLFVGDTNDDILAVRNGTVAAPVITNFGNYGNGLYFPSNTSMAASILGVQHQVWTSTGSDITGNFTISGTLGVTGNVAINTNKFNVTAASGDTTIAGTLGVTGATTLSSTLAVTGNTTVQGDLAVNGGDITTGATTMALLDTTATTINFARAATSITIGATSGTLSIRNTAVSITGNETVGGTLAVTGGTTLSSTLAVTGATTLSSTLAVTGNTTLTGDLAVNGADITTSATTFNLVDSTATTINFGGAATALVVGATTGTCTLRNATVAITGNETVGGTLAVTGNTTLTGDLAVNGADITTTATTFNLVNATATTLNLGGAATSLVVGATTGTATIRNATVAITGNETVGGTLAVTGNTTLSTLGVTGDTTLTGDLAVNGADITTSATTFNLVNATATTLNLGGAASSMTIGAATGVMTLRNATVAITGNETVGGTLAVTGNTTLTGDLAVNGADITTSATTFNLVDTTATTLNLARAATSLVIGATTGTATIRNATVAITGNETVGGTLAVTGNTSLSTLGVSGASTLAGVSVTSLTTSQTSKVVNLNADKVDGYDVDASGAVGALSYVRASDNIGFITPGTAGMILQSAGAGASPTWVAADGLSAGNALLSSNIIGGTTGDLLYQNAVDSTAKLPIGTVNRVLTSSGVVPQWSTSLALPGTLGVTGATTLAGLSHTGLTATSGSNIDQVVSVTDTALVVGTSWVNTSINGAELQTGSYMVQVISGVEVYTGVMSWIADNINSAVTDEVILHKASSGAETGSLFMRVERTDDSGSADMTLQLSASVARGSANYFIKLRRLL